jgi:hypothetical protein
MTEDVRIVAAADLKKSDRVRAVCVEGGPWTYVVPSVAKKSEASRMDLLNKD